MSTTDRTEQSPVRDAWQRVADGFTDALEIEGLPRATRARLIRCRLLALKKIGERPLAAVHTAEGEGD